MPIVAAITMVITALGVGVVFVVVTQGGRRCSTCGATLPRGVETCPTCATDSPLPRPEGGPFELVAITGPLAQQRFPIPPQGLTIGRQRDNDVALVGEAMISRQHAILVMEEGQVVVYDRESANGTWVNEERIFRRALAPGDRLQIWQSQFALARAGAPPAPQRRTQAPAKQPEVRGDRFGDYRLEGIIGRGGMSEVYRARNREGHVVALKILQHTDPYLVDKFVQEGNQIGPLLRGHPNIVYVHEFGRGPDGRLYIAMELVEAPSLRKRMRQPVDEAAIVSLIGQVCRALGYAHQNAVVHRDIKPENILVTDAGVAKVLDFGIAKLTSAATVTRDKVIGTPEYISPEQARGEPVTPASDVYSLGIVLYELLAGRVPFPRASRGDPLKIALAVVRQHMVASPPPLHARDRGGRVSPHLEQVAMRALAKRASERYASATEMGQALGAQPTSNLPGVAPPRTRARLRILSGPKRGQTFELGGEQVLGRVELDPSNQLISRQHMVISVRAGGCWLQDRSKNGTWVDNQRAYGEVPLYDGSVISVGETTLRLEIDQQP